MKKIFGSCLLISVSRARIRRNGPVGRLCAVVGLCGSRHRAPRYSHDNEARSAVSCHAWGRGGGGWGRKEQVLDLERVDCEATRFRKRVVTNAALMNSGQGDHDRSGWIQRCGAVTTTSWVWKVTSLWICTWRGSRNPTRHTDCLCPGWEGQTNNSVIVLVYCPFICLPSRSNVIGA